MAKVLVIDDDPFIVRLIRAKIEQLGHEVITAADGEDGITAAIEADPDLVLLDLMMPRINGLEVCHALREKETVRHIPIVMLTGKGQEQDIEQGFAAGATEYLVKPFSPRELQARVRALIGQTAQVAG